MPVDPLDYRKIIGNFATGVTIVTAEHDGEPYGMTANSVTSLSLEPTLLLVCFVHGSKTGIAAKESGAFGVNILDDSQEEISNKFASTANDWDGIDWETGAHGIPMLKQSIGSVICRVDEVVEGGDHEILIGAVTDIDAGDADAAPLLFYQGKYRRLAS